MKILIGLGYRLFVVTLPGASLTGTTWFHAEETSFGTCILSIGKGSVTMNSFSLSFERYVVWRGVNPSSWVTIMGASTSFKDLMVNFVIRGRRVSQKYE